MVARFRQYMDSGRTSEDAPQPVMEFEPHEAVGSFLPGLQTEAGCTATGAWKAFSGGLGHETVISTITQLRAKEVRLERFEHGHDLFPRGRAGVLLREDFTRNELEYLVRGSLIHTVAPLPFEDRHGNFIDGGGSVSM
jgi:hypothetical protein